MQIKRDKCQVVWSIWLSEYWNKFVWMYVCININLCVCVNVEAKGDLFTACLLGFD